MQSSEHVFLKVLRFFTDVLDMTFSQLFVLVKNVIISPEVIIITILLILYLNLVHYVVCYHKPQLPSLQSRIQRSLQKPPEEIKTENQPAAVSS